jgi:hypothetical protein
MIKKMWAYETTVVVLLSSSQPLNRITEFYEAYYEHYPTRDRLFAYFQFRTVCTDIGKITRNSEIVTRKIIFVWQLH